LIAKTARQPKIDQHVTVRVCEHDVGRVDITMQQTRLVNSGQGGSNTNHHFEHFVNVERMTSLCEHFAHRLPIDEFHRHVHGVVRFDDFKNPHDSGH